jgi:hypothetical protein
MGKNFSAPRKKDGLCRGVKCREQRASHGGEGSSQGKSPWLLRVGQGAGGVEEAGAEKEGLLLARKRSRGTCAHGAGRGAEGGTCCSLEGGADHGEERSRAPCCWLLLLP